MKISQKEQRVLKALQNGEFGYYAPFQGRFNPQEYYSVGSIGKCTREIKKLLKLGLVVLKQKTYNSWDILLTDEGKNFKCELEDPYDVWAVESEFGGNKVNKYSGFLKGSTLSLARGGTARETDNRKFFLERDKAFGYAIERQELNIRYQERKVNSAKERLDELKKHQEDPTLDKAGYL